MPTSDCTPKKTVEVPVPSSDIHRDLDTPEDYARLLQTVAEVERVVMEPIGQNRNGSQAQDRRQAEVTHQTTAQPRRQAIVEPIRRANRTPS